MLIIQVLLSFIVLAFVGLMLLRMRIRVYVDDHERILFAGLGRSGVELDFLTKQGVVRLFGFRAKSFAMQVGKDSENDKVKEAEPAVAKQPAKASSGKQRRRLQWREWLEVLRESRSATFSFVRGIFQGLIVEELYGHIRGGFERPDLTGEAYGYYEALMSCVPQTRRYFRFEPDWTGPSFSGILRLSVALPLYRFVWQLALLLIRLPIRKIRMLTIHGKRGVSHA